MGWNVSLLAHVLERFKHWLIALRNALKKAVNRNKTYGDVGHSTQIVDFMGLDFRYDMEKICRVRKVAVVEEQADTSLHVIWQIVECRYYYFVITVA